MFIRRLFLSVLFLLLCQFSGLSHATSLYYILDGSGSMWGRVDGEIKIVAAKKVMTRLVNEMPAGVTAGLTVYGHKRKGDCSDITEIIPLGLLDRNQAIKAIQSIKPMGKTPIANSIQLIADKLKDQEDETTIVLVSDGIETCGGDPCAVTKSLKDAGIKFVIHTVGFDVGKKASEQLSCIARVGGGSYFPALSAKDLLETLTTVQKSIVTMAPVVTPPPPPEPEQIIQKTTSSSTSHKIKVKRPGKITFSLPSWWSSLPLGMQTPDYWKLIDPETGEEKGKFNALKGTRVPEGEYQIVWKQHPHRTSPIVLSEVVTVKAGEESVVPLLTSMQFHLPSWVKEPDNWKLVDPETGEEVYKSSLLEPCLVPAGEYNLIWRQDAHYTKDIILSTVNLEADKLNTIEVSTAFNPVPADWLPKYVYSWELREISKDGKGKTVAKFAEDFDQQLVPVGKYHFVYHFSQHGSSESFLGEVEIAPAKMNEFMINTGVVFILPEGEPLPYYVEIVELDKDGNEGRKVWLKGGYLRETLDPIALSPGTYKINYQQKQHNSSIMTIVETFDLPAGNMVEVEL